MRLTKKFWFTGLLSVVTFFVAGNAFSAGSGDLLIRGRIINVSPNDDSSDISTISGAGVGVESQSTIEVDFTYMMNSNIGLELILATTKHDLVGTGVVSGLGTIGEVGVLPPTLTAQYHFSPSASLRPYAGVGLNYTLFYSEKASSSLEGALGSTSLSLENSFGLAAQAGADFDLNKDWYLNVDLKYIQIDTTATLVTGATTRTVDVDINPWVMGVGIGKTF